MCVGEKAEEEEWRSSGAVEGGGTGDTTADARGLCVRVTSKSVVLLHPGSVLMSVACVTIKAMWMSVVWTTT